MMMPSAHALPSQEPQSPFIIQAARREATARVGVRGSPPSPNLRACQAICGSVGNAQDPQYTSLTCAAEVGVWQKVRNVALQPDCCSFFLAGSGTVRCGGTRRWDVLRMLVLVRQRAETPFKGSILDKRREWFGCDDWRGDAKDW